MTYDIIKKNVYYDPPSEYPHSSRNHAEDLQDFHLPLQRAHHAAIHDRGIAAGLEVTGAPGATQVAIALGVAVDGAGQIIVLAGNGHGDIGNNPPAGDTNEVTVPVSLPLGSMAGKTAYVTIQFSQILRPAEGSGGRLEQVPWLRLQPTTGAGAYVDDGTSVILAIAAINGAGNLTSLKESDSTLPFGRATLGVPAGEVRVRRSRNDANKLHETISGKLKPGAGGGLQMTVPGAGDSIALSNDSGGNCSGIEMRANSVTCKDAAGRDVVHIDTNHAWLRVGAQGNEGDLLVVDQRGNLGFAFDGSACRLDIGAVQNPGHLYMRGANAALTMHLDGNAGAVNANLLRPFNRNVIDVDASFFRIHGLDLVLDGRSGGNKRALVDLNNRLAVNFANDYAGGVSIAGLHLQDHVKVGYWEGADVSKRPDYSKWVPLFSLNSGLKFAEWDFVTMCEVGMFDDGLVETFWWGLENDSGPDQNDDIIINWMVQYRDRFDDWRPWKWNVMMLAFRR